MVKLNKGMRYGLKLPLQKCTYLRKTSGSHHLCRPKVCVTLMFTSYLCMCFITTCKHNAFHTCMCVYTYVRVK